jgi:hypothetical protein
MSWMVFHDSMLGWVVRVGVLWMGMGELTLRDHRTATVVGAVNMSIIVLYCVVLWWWVMVGWLAEMLYA